MRRIIKVFIFFYIIVHFLFIFLFWNKWSGLWIAYYNSFIPNITSYFVPILFGFTVTITTVKNINVVWQIIAYLFGIIGFVFMGFILYQKSFVIKDSCACERLFVFLPTNLHFWINTAFLGCLFVEILILFYKKKISK